MKKGTISQKTINYAAHLQNDPDNLMTSLVYDWYFNGSNLETIEEGKEIYLIQPAFGENYELDSMKLTNSSEVILGSTRSAKFKDYTAKYCYEIIKPRLYPTTFELALRKKNSLRFIKHWRNKRIKKTHYTITWQKALWAGSFIGLDGFSFLDSDNVLTNIQTSTMQPLWSKSIGEDISQAFPATLGKIIKIVFI